MSSLTRRSESSAADATVIHYLALAGGQYQVGSFAKTTASATASQPVTGVRFRPVGLLLTSFNKTASTAIVSEGRISLGASDGTTEGAIWYHDLDNQGTTVVKVRSSTTKVAVHASGTTLNAEADLSSFDANGFTLSWTTNNAVAEEILYAAFGPRRRVMVVQ